MGNGEYPRIAKRAKLERAEIRWGDEAGLRSEDVCGRGYAPKGRTPVVLANANREKPSVISTVTYKDEMRWTALSDALNAQIPIGFTERLIRRRERKIFLALDNRRDHRSKPAKKWLVVRAGQIEVFDLPGHSPESTLDDLPNADLEQRMTKAAPPSALCAASRNRPEAWKVRACKQTFSMPPERIPSKFEALQ